MATGNPLNIAVASIGRFHMFDLARQLASLGENARLYTGYPKFKVDPDLRPSTRTRSPWVLLEQLRARLPGGASMRLSLRAAKDFGAWLARQLDRGGIDVLDALDGAALEAGRLARSQGAAWVCNRGSAHVVTQKELLEEEHRRWGNPLPPGYFLPELIDRCLAEYEEAHAIAVPSSFARQSFIDQGLAAEKVHVCPYGVDLSMFRPLPKEDRRFRVLFVGAQSIQKGIGYLFDAVRPLVEAGSVELWLVGRPDREARHILDANGALFVHKGVQPRANLSWFYSQASVLVLPSIQEGLALVQAQAMACGVPVIATTNTGAEDLFTSGVDGFIVPVRDPLAIREKIRWMLDNPEEREEMAAAALRRVKQLGGWSEYGRRMARMYRQVLGAMRAPVRA